jgi:hypothetical protein
MLSYDPTWHIWYRPIYSHFTLLRLCIVMSLHRTVSVRMILTMVRSSILAHLTNENRSSVTQTLHYHPFQLTDFWTDVWVQSYVMHITWRQSHSPKWFLSLFNWPVPVIEPHIPWSRVARQLSGHSSSSSSHVIIYSSCLVWHLWLTNPFCDALILTRKFVRSPPPGATITYFLKVSSSSATWWRNSELVISHTRWTIIESTISFSGMGYFMWLRVYVTTA